MASTWISLRVDSRVNRIRQSPIRIVIVFKNWRREWDSNPRGLAP